MRSFVCGFLLALLVMVQVGCGGVVGSGPVNSSSNGSGSVSSGSPSTPSTPSPTPSSGGSADIPANAHVINDIQLMPNWSSCSGDCSGEFGTNGVYTMQPGISQPSVTGSAIRFDLQGGTPWGTALWWKQLGGDDTKTHFVYELQFYLDNPSASQALEFAVNQNGGGWRYEYAVQCDIKGSHKWRVWNRHSESWKPSSVGCPMPTANQWHKLVWEFERTADHKVVFAAVTLDGQRSEINMTADAFTASGSGIDVAYQMDAEGGPTPYSSWVDAIKLTEW